jgi:hypothetical protein
MAVAYDDVELSTIVYIYGQYKRRAIRKGYEFSFNLKDFYAILKRNCYYCDAPPRKVKHSSKRSLRFAYINGIDRYINSIGYLPSNSVPCCPSCNYFKGSLDGDVFIAKIKLIAEVIYGKSSAEVYNNPWKEVQNKVH